MKTTFLLFTMVCLMSVNLSAQPGTLDSSFGINGDAKIFIANNFYASITAIQDDGKIVLAGNNGNAGLSTMFFLARLLPNGNPDSTFGTNGVAIPFNDGQGNYVDAITIQKNGSIVLGGVANGNDFLLIRYTLNGKIDSTFGTNGKVVTDVGGYDQVSSLAIQNDGKILAAGEQNPSGYVARYNVNGRIDSSFGTNGLLFSGTLTIVSVKSLANGEFIIAGYGNDTSDINDYSVYFVIKRFLSNGTVDSSFGKNGNTYVHFTNNPSSHANDMSIGKNNDIIVVGYTSNGSFTNSAIAKIKSSGVVDSAFGINGIVTTTLDGYGNSAVSVLIQDDGKIIVTTRSSNYSNSTFKIGRFLQNGVTDSSFGINGIFTPKVSSPDYYGFFPPNGSTAIQKDGKIIVVGSKDYGYFNAERIKGDTPITVSIRKNISITEGNTGLTPAAFQVVLNRASSLAVSVKVKTIDGTALNGSDYNANSGTLTIKPGKLSAKITVNIIADAIKEPNETFSLVLSNPVNASLGDLDTATCLIKNDDAGLAANDANANDVQTAGLGLKIYPNPAKETLRIQGLNTGGKTTISIFDMQGNTVIKTTTGNSNFTVNVKNLAPGTYYVKIDSNIKTETIKFIKE